MLMGIYLFIIAIKDARFRDNYKEEASAWMSSWSCTFLGVLAMTSSEVRALTPRRTPQFAIRNVQLLFNSTVCHGRATAPGEICEAIVHVPILRDKASVN